MPEIARRSSRPIRLGCSIWLNLRLSSSPARPDLHARAPWGGPMTVMPMAIAKAVPFVMAVFLLLTPSLLAAQVPTSGAGKPDGAVSQAPIAAETNDSAEIAQKLTNPLAAMISIPIQNWFDFNLGP